MIKAKAPPVFSHACYSSGKICLDHGYGTNLLQVANSYCLLIVFSLSGIKVVPDFLLQELSVLNGLVIWLDFCPIIRV